jgi:Zn ribbon nucleic-acid-binding protein
MTDPQCPECKGQIQLGVAIAPEEEGGCWWWRPPITYKNLELIPVYKCVNCGYSCNDVRNLVWVRTPEELAQDPTNPPVDAL